jgi:H(+)-transporting ATP synthase, vacuolar type, subunit D
MARLNVNPTRMELSRLNKKLDTAERGHKLLKDKLDELVRQFILLVKKNQLTRKKMEDTLQIAMFDYVMASSSMSDAVLEEVFAIPMNEISLDVQTKTIMNIDVPIFHTIYAEENDENLFSYGFMSTTSELDVSLNKLSSVLPVMLDLAEIEKTCQLLAEEIERTRRRVNALEFMTIPQLNETIDYIKMKLAENERDVITRMLKIKDIVK